MMPATQDEVAAAREALEAVRKEVARVYIGPSQPIDHMLVALLARGHVLLEGVPGVAKTTLAKAFAASLGVKMRRIQFTPDLLPADITGTYVLAPRDGTFSFRQGPIFANLVLADEINRAPPKTQAALLEAMQEQQVTVEGDSFELPDPYLVVATQNPIDLEGTYPLPEAQIDRFLVRVALTYPPREDEIAMLKTHHAAHPTANAVVNAERVRKLQDVARRIHVENDLYEYAVSITEHTRTDRRVLLGASPRATLGLVQAAKAAALLAGRSFATPDDLRGFAVSVLAHRLVLAEDQDSGASAGVEVVESTLRRVSYRKSVRTA